MTSRTIGLAQAATLGGLIAGALTVYALLLTLFGAIDWADLRPDVIRSRR